MDDGEFIAWSFSNHEHFKYIQYKVHGLVILNSTIVMIVCKLKYFRDHTMRKTWIEHLRWYDVVVSHQLFKLCLPLPLIFDSFQNIIHRLLKCHLKAIISISNMLWWWTCMWWNCTMELLFFENYRNKMKTMFRCKKSVTDVNNTFHKFKHLITLCRRDIML